MLEADKQVGTVAIDQQPPSVVRTDESCRAGHDSMFHCTPRARHRAP
jgi:hypothetical protein